MQIKEFLESVCEQIKYKPIHSEVSAEMENHLRETKENLILEGFSEQEAEQKAIAQMGSAEEIGKKLNQIHKPKLDWKLLLLTVILIIFGSLVTFTRATNCWNYVDDKGAFPYWASMSYHFFTVAVAVILSIGIYFMDYRKFLKRPAILYGIATFFMIYTKKFGLQFNGVNAHYAFLGFVFYTPGFTVPLYMLAFIGFIKNINLDKMLKIFFLKKEIRIHFDILRIIILSAISLILLEMVPATVLMVVLGIVYLMIATIRLLECTKNRKMYIAVLWGVPVVLGMLIMIVLLPMAWQRLVGSFAPEQDPKGRGWIGVNQQMILESANLFGKADNMSNAISMFDEGTNFAFISILAHYGWMVSIAMVIAIVAFSIKLMLNVAKVKDRVGKMIIIGVSGLFILQGIFNLLMNLNIGIKSNVNIPFISYGRQDLIINMMCLALVLSVYRRKDILTKRRKWN